MLLVNSFKSKPTRYVAIAFLCIAFHSPQADNCLKHSINFNLTHFNDYSYQGKNNTVTIVEQGCGVYISDNGWALTEKTYTITEDTVLEFGYIGSGQGNIHGIGFNKNITRLNDKHLFNIFGEEDFGLFDYRYKTTGTYQEFSIPIGQYFTGEGFHLALGMDQDISNNAAGYFENIRLIQTDRSVSRPHKQQTSTPNNSLSTLIPEHISKNL